MKAAEKHRIKTCALRSRDRLDVFEDVHLEVVVQTAVLACPDEFFSYKVWVSLVVD